MTVDYDNDGRLDVVVTNNNGRANLYRDVTAIGTPSVRG